MGVLYLFCAAAACAGLAAAGYAAGRLRSEKRMLHRINTMLYEAVRGSFSEKSFDESLLSAAEAKLADFLAASLVSAENMGREKDRIKTLIADISHQTKTPVANILLYTQLLAEQELSEEGRVCAAALEEQAEKLQLLILALVKTSRLEAGILALHPKENPVGPMLEEAAAAYARRAEEKNIILHAEPSGETAVFDRKWTEEAVCNLVDNAVKYTPQGGRIVIRATPYELFCRIDVVDSGIGVAPEERAKIFGRFYRSEAAYETEGVGIGLYLVRQIASGQGGYVKVSGAPGGGSVFSLYLPKT